MDLGIRDTIALVTSASRGLGRAIALGLADEGCHVGIVDRGTKSVAVAAGEIEARGVRAIPIVSDLTEASSPGDTVNWSIEE